MLRPRVLVVDREQWPRALLRAQLLEEGYDAIGSPTLAAALRVPVQEPGRGPVRVVVIDQSALEPEWPERVSRLKAMHAHARFLLVARGTAAPPPGPWDAVLRRPCAIGDLVAAVRKLAAGP